MIWFDIFFTVISFLTTSIKYKSLSQWNAFFYSLIISGNMIAFTFITVMIIRIILRTIIDNNNNNNNDDNIDRSDFMAVAMK